MFYILNWYVVVCLFNNSKFQSMFTVFTKMSANVQKPVVTKCVGTICETEFGQSVVKPVPRLESV